VLIQRKHIYDADDADADNVDDDGDDDGDDDDEDDGDGLKHHRRQEILDAIDIGTLEKENPWMSVFVLCSHTCPFSPRCLTLFSSCNTDCSSN
jgi:hypothetical protein